MSRALGTAVVMDGCSGYPWWIIREMFTACGLDVEAKFRNYPPYL
jgi:hypothetical protein